MLTIHKTIAAATLAACAILAQPASAVVSPGSGHYPPVPLESLQARSFMCEMQSRLVYKVDVQPPFMKVTGQDGYVTTTKEFFNFTYVPAHDAFGMYIPGNMDWDWDTANTPGSPNHTPLITLNPEGWDFFYMGEYGRCLMT